MATNNRTTPATASKLYAQLDDMLSPTRATTPEPPTTPPTVTSLVDDMNEIARRSQPRPPRVPQPESVALHEAYEWDPEPTVDDPCGLRERMDTLETAIAARTSPRQAVPVVDPQAETRATRLIEAHRRIEAILG
jgi:hypothetical protein